MIDYEAEVEQLLGGAPDALAFRALCAAVSRVDDPDLVARCGERLTSWPDEVREVPWSWLAALESGHTNPAWPLVRALRLKSARCGIADVGLPDPRTRPEVRGVTRLHLGWFAHRQLEELVDTLDHWPDLRVVETGLVTEMDEDVVTGLAAHPGVARLESLDLVTAHEDMWNFTRPPFRPPAGRPLRLRHVGLRAPDLVYLLRSGLVPDLRSADVLVCDTEEARDLAECPGLARLERLAIGFRCGKNGRQPLWQPFFGNVIDADDDAAEVFFARADLTGLRDLAVRGTCMGLGREGLGARGVEALVASGVPGRLTALTLELLPVADDTITRVVNAVDRDRIEELALRDLVATDLTAAAFTGTFPRLRELDLSRNHLGAEGARRLATEVRLPALTHLHLNGSGSGSPYYGRPDVQPLGDDGARAWADSANAANLRHLDLMATGLGVDGLAALMRSDRLGALETLVLSHNPVGRWPDVPVSLRFLDLTDCGLGDDDVEALTASAAPLLRGISLAYNNIGSRGMRALAAWPVLPQLWELDLHDHIAGDDGLAALAASRAAQRLLELDLEQDCWNARHRRFGTPLPAEVVDPASFPGLDSMFLGVVDEYHGARYSSGFPPRVREELAAAPGTRPELVAFLTHLDAEELEDADPEQEPDRSDRDFRTRWAESHAELVEVSLDFARRMKAGDIGWPP